MHALVAELSSVEIALQIEMAREIRRLLDRQPAPAPSEAQADVAPAPSAATGGAADRLRLPGGGCAPASASA